METRARSHRRAKSLQKNLSPISLFRNVLIKPFVFAVISSSCRAGIFQALSPRRGSRAALSVQQKVITHRADFTAPARDLSWGCFSDYFTESSRKPDLGRVPVLPPWRAGGESESLFQGRICRSLGTHAAGQRVGAVCRRRCRSGERAAGRAVPRGLSLRRGQSGHRGPRRATGGVAVHWRPARCGAGMGQMGLIQGAEAALSCPVPRSPRWHACGTRGVGVCPSR